MGGKSTWLASPQFDVRVARERRLTKPPAYWELAGMSSSTSAYDRFARARQDDFLAAGSPASELTHVGLIEALGLTLLTSPGN
jgi:hypothetical protein